MNNNTNNKTTLKRRNESTTTTDNNKRSRPRLDMSKGPRIPVRPTLASRSANATSPTTNGQKRFSDASTSSNASIKGRLSNASTSSITGRQSNGSMTSRSSVTGRPSNSSVTSNGSTVRRSTMPTPSTSVVKKTTVTTSRKPPVTTNTTIKKRTLAAPVTTASKAPVPKPTTSKTTVPKIPSWDIRGKMNHLQNKLEETGGEVQNIEKLHDDLQSTVQSKESLLQEAIQKVNDLQDTKQLTIQRHEEELLKIQEKHLEKNRQLIFEHDRDKNKLEKFEEEIQYLEAQYKNTVVELEDERRENGVLRTVKEKTNASYSEVDASLRHLKMKLKSAGTSLAEHEKCIEDLKNEFKDKTENCKELEQSILKEEKLRRKLHNTIQELKGNIRVFCRVRPSISINEESQLATINFFGEDQEKMELLEQVSSTFGKSATKSHAFSFDRVFSPESTQKDCFEEISQLVQSALDGYNVCIFAYGQTGSGKTFTMQGPPNTSDKDVGMIPRAVHQIYNVAQELKQMGWEYQMEGQFLEIYNETIHDLLGDVSNYGKLKHEIYHEKNGKTTVTEMTNVVLDSPNKVKNMLRKASQNRATGATNLNERSSRSHSVFTLKLNGVNATTGEKTIGILNLIDLAGSERLSMSGSVGDRLRETQAINKSLSCLGDVIHALVNNKEGGHIPYRNSKLTYLLRNSLGGNCKTLMFVNVSPMMEHFGETLCSLRFATKVNSCQIGTAKKSK